MGLRVAIAEDSMLVREGIRQVIERQPDLAVVAVAKDLDGLRAALAAQPEDEPVDVVVTDVRMPPDFTDEGIRLAVELRGSHPGIGGHPTTPAGRPVCFAAEGRTATVRRPA